MKTLSLALLAACLSCAALPAAGHAEDIVTTRDSTVIRGRIIEEAPGDHLVIRTATGELDTVVWDSVGVIRRGEHPGKKSPWLSWALSFLVFPGIGQYYNGDVATGIACNALALGGAIMALSTEDSSDDSAGQIGSTIYLLTWVFSSIEAPVRSSAINRERGLAALPDATGRWLATGVPPHERPAPVIPLAQVTWHF